MAQYGVSTVKRATQMIWGDSSALVTIPGVGANTDLPDVIIPASWLPTGYTLISVVAVVKWREIADTSGAANKIDGAQEIHVQRAGGTYTAAIEIADDMLSVDGNGVSAGDIIVGHTDIKAQVNSDNITANFRWVMACADGASILLRDVQTGLYVTYEVTN